MFPDLFGDILKRIPCPPYRCRKEEIRSFCSLLFFPEIPCMHSLKRQNRSEQAHRFFLPVHRDSRTCHPQGGCLPFPISLNHKTKSRLFIANYLLSLFAFTFSCLLSIILFATSSMELFVTSIICIPFT